MDDLGTIQVTLSDGWEYRTYEKKRKASARTNQQQQGPKEISEAALKGKARSHYTGFSSTTKILCMIANLFGQRSEYETAD